MNLDALMRKIGSDDETDNGGLTDIQIIGRLTSIHDLRAEKHKFKPGQIIRHRFGDMSNSICGRQPCIFIRYLDKPYVAADHPEAFEDVTDWSSMAAPRRYDCVIGTITETSFSEFFVESADFRPATEDEYGPAIND